MAFQSRRHLSRQGNVAKRLTQNELANAIELEIRRILFDHDPTIRKPAVLAASRLAGVIAMSIAMQTQFVQRSLSAVQPQLEALAGKFIDKVLAEALHASGPSQVDSIGSMPPLSTQANASLALPDDWAGPVAGPTLLERRYGLARSTLFRWMKRGEVVSLRTRGNRPVFPLAQFVDGRPADGIPELITIFGDPRRAWQWLSSPCEEFDDGCPIDELLAGRIELVCQTARSTIALKRAGDANQSSLPSRSFEES